jgi:hypothetical protein
VIGDNSDQFRIDEFDSPLDYIFRSDGYSKNRNLTNVDYFLIVVTFESDSEMIILSVYQNPNPNIRSLFGFSISVSQYLLNFLEQRIETLHIVKSRIVISHFPLSSVYNRTLTSIPKQTLTELFFNEDIYLVLSDDNDPEIVVFESQKGLFEVNFGNIFYHRPFKFLKFDCDEIFDNFAKLDELMFTAVTYPIFKEQLNHHLIFTFENRKAAVISLTANRNLMISMNRDVIGALKLRHIFNLNLSLSSVLFNFQSVEYCVNLSVYFNK